MMTIQSIEAASGRRLRTFDEFDDAALDQTLARAADAFRLHRATPIGERARWLRRACKLLLDEKEWHARTMAEEMGKVLRAGVAEIEKCALACRYFADHAARFLADEPAADGARTAFVRCLPLGPILAIMPWNFPFWQVFRFAAPALAAGNAAILKHASNVPQCALAIEDLLRRAGVPDGLFQTVLVSSARTGRLIADPRIRAITLTGSDAAGADVAEKAGRHLKKTVLELGGSDPFIVMPSADLDAAIATAVAARTVNSGQSCIAAKRFIVHRDIYPRFERGMVDAFARLRIGDPLAPDTDIGPLASEEVLRHVARQVRDSVEAGARLLVGGHPGGGPHEHGWWFTPGVLADIPPAAPAYREEVFGPVALLFVARDLDHAIELANDSPYGLGSAVWTRDSRDAQRCIDELETGLTFVNGMVASEPGLPFGGVKRSGYGRELARDGIREFVNLKSVVIAPVRANEARP